jgi:integrase
VNEPIARRRRRQRLTDRQVAALPRRRARYFHPDPELPGHGVRVPVDGLSSFYVVARDAFKKLRWVPIGNTAELKIEAAREIARSVIRRLKQGLAPFAPPPVKRDSVAAVFEGWAKRHVEAQGLRTGAELRRIAERHVLPVWRDRPFAEIRRSDIANLLDAVEDAHGPWVADSVLGVLRSMATWYAARNDAYTPPFVRKMRRTPAQIRKRSRILDDDELRRVWTAAEGAGGYGAFLQILLLTGQRLGAVLLGMKWADIDFERGVWVIPVQPRAKGHAGTVVLPETALRIIRAQPKFIGNPHVFAAQRGSGPFTGLSARKAEFDERCGVIGWTQHDLRRCARSLMARAGVRPDVAERVLGHAVGNQVERTYDVHGYDSEKADALRRLATLIEEIVGGEPGGNVRRLRAAAVRP